MRPPAECLEQVAELVRLLKRPLSRLGLQVAWTPREAYHLTLKFLGNVDEAELGAMVARVQTELGGHQGAAGAPLELTGLGVFPGPQRPQVLYVDARRAADPVAAPAGRLPELHALQTLLEDALAPLGYPRDERAFHPHLTIGRVRRIAAELPAALPELLQRYAAHRHGPAFPVATLILYESQPAPSGPRYTPLAQLPLAAAGAAP